MMFHLERAVRYLLYPVLLTATFACCAAAIKFHWSYKATYPLVTIALVITLVVLERILPFDRKWSMTGTSFLRDLKYIAVDAPTIALVKSATGVWAIYYAERHSRLFSGAPVWLEVIAFLLIFELLQYWFHRCSHEAEGPVGRFLWKTHAVHHLPDRVYVVMHAVFHPLNALITALIIQFPLVVLGVSPEAALAATLLIDLQSLVSHFNVDLRAGWLNYVFIGTETHRYHHSADPGDAGNYGNTLAIWDLIFGTFRYRPGIAPSRLGIRDPENYPDSNELRKVLALPFS